MTSEEPKDLFAPDVEWAKVTYITLDGYKTQAYIDLRDGRGENKHSDTPVTVRWDVELDTWVEVAPS